MLVKEPGTFRVQLNYAVPKQYAGSSISLECAGQSVPGVVPATKGWSDYQMLDLGVLTVKKPGEYTVVLRAQKMVAEGVMNLRFVTLTPSK